MVDVPVGRNLLLTENLGQLEELSINYAAEYCISATSGTSEPTPLPLLKHLHLEMAEDYSNLTRWLNVAPNLKEVF